MHREFYKDSKKSSFAILRISYELLRISKDSANLLHIGPYRHYSFESQTSQLDPSTLSNLSPRPLVGINSRGACQTCRCRPKEARRRRWSGGGASVGPRAPRGQLGSARGGPATSTVAAADDSTAAAAFPAAREARDRWYGFRRTRGGGGGVGLGARSGRTTTARELCSDRRPWRR